MRNLLKHPNPVKSAISVIIPAYNAAPFIREAIDSVLSQSVQPLEILVIDDGSSDETARIAAEYEPPVFLLKQKNRGVSAARNLGIVEAAGEFIAFLDADDVFIDSGKLEKQLACLAEKSCDLVLTGWRITDERLNRISDRYVWLEVPHLNLFNWVRAPAILPSTMLVRRENLLEINGFDENITNSEDVDLIFRLTQAGCLAAWLPEITVAYRQHSSNATRQVRRQAEGIEKVLNKLFARSDLPPAVRHLEREIRYRNLTWSAYHCLAAGDLAGMKKYLLASRRFADFEGETFLVNWFYIFARCSGNQASFNKIACRLLSSKEWADLEEMLIH